MTEYQIKVCTDDAKGTGSSADVNGTVWKRDLI